MEYIAEPLLLASKAEGGAWAIREAKIEDLTAIAEIERKVYVLEGPWALDEFQESFVEPDTLYLVAVVGEQIVGYSAANIENNVGGLIASTVLPEYRRQGIAKEFLRLRLEWLDSQVKEIIMETRVDNDVILNSYKAYGFKNVGLLSDYYNVGVHAFQMRRVLESQ